jgi:hypothetical protein
MGILRFFKTCVHTENSCLNITLTVTISFFMHIVTFVEHFLSGLSMSLHCTTCIWWDHACSCSSVSITYLRHVASGATTILLWGGANTKFGTLSHAHRFGEFYHLHTLSERFWASEMEDNFTLLDYTKISGRPDFWH